LLQSPAICADLEGIKPEPIIAMSHIRNIDGNPHAAAEYQAYLARMAAARRARKGEDQVRSFDSAIDPDQESAEDPGEEAGEGGPEDREPQGEPGDGEKGPTDRLIGRC
jgi:hypothetical protein